MTNLHYHFKEKLSKEIKTTIDIVWRAITEWLAIEKSLSKQYCNFDIHAKTFHIDVYIVYYLGTL